jgi:hypothetical protein
MTRSGIIIFGYDSNSGVWFLTSGIAAPRACSYGIGSPPIVVLVPFLLCPGVRLAAVARYGS